MFLNILLKVFEGNYDLRLDKTLKIFHARKLRQAEIPERLIAVMNRLLSDTFKGKFNYYV